MPALGGGRPSTVSRQQTCLAHDVADALKADDDTLALPLKLWLDAVLEAGVCPQQRDIRERATFRAG